MRLKSHSELLKSNVSGAAVLGGNYEFHLIGAGATGSYILPALAAMYYRSLVYVYDGDIIEPKNTSTQNFNPRKVGSFKAHALTEEVNLKTPYRLFKVDSISKYIHSFNSLRSPRYEDGLNVIILAVDDMETRNIIFNGVCKQAENSDQEYILIDPRSDTDYNMLWFLNTKDPDFKAKAKIYKDHLFTNEEAEGEACGARLAPDATVTVAGHTLITLRKGIENHFLRKEESIPLWDTPLKQRFQYGELRIYP